MARPLVLVAWEPKLPEEALAVQERLDPVAQVEWIHELSPSLAAEFLPQTVALLVGSWPQLLTEALPRMRRLRLVACVPGFLRTVPVESLRAMGVDVVEGSAPKAAPGPRAPERHVEAARATAERVAAYLRRASQGVNLKSSGTGAPL